MRPAAMLDLMTHQTEVPVLLPLDDIFSAGYVAAGFAFSAMYVPRVRTMLRDQAATARSHSLTVESLWTLCRTVSLAYVATVACDPLISLTVSLDLLGRFAMLTVIV